MSEITFEPARREKVKLRCALIGPPGSGKTLGALNIARALGEPVYGIDTEHGRMKLYADRFEFAHGNLTDKTPEGYVQAIRAAVQAGAGTVILDSASHEWLAVLTEADRFSNWKELTPRHNDFVNALVEVPAHVIVTMRAKVKYDVSEVEEGGRKKQKIERIGIGPVQRENVEYEFDVLGYLDESHEATFLNRCDALVGKTMTVPEAVPLIVEWLEHGEPDPNMQRAPEGKVEELRALLLAEGQAPAIVEDAFRRVAVRSGGVLTLGWVEEKIEAAIERSKGERKAGNQPAPAPKNWAEMKDQLEAAYTADVLPDFEAFVVDLSVHMNEHVVDDVFGRRVGELSRAEWTLLQQKAAGAAANLLTSVESGFPGPSRAELQAAFASVIDGVELPGPHWRMSPDETDRPPRGGQEEDVDPEAEAIQFGAAAETT